MRTRRWIAALAVNALIGVGLVVGAPAAGAATGDIGYQDQSYAGVTNPPTSDKPQSKLWYAGGYWFAVMFETVSKTWRIFRLDRSTETWVDTKVQVDTRVNTLADTLWDGSKLYIASHVVAYSTEASPKPSTTGNPARLTRYSYNATTKAFTLDSGFPTVITQNSSESMTIDKDSTGKIWATWTQVAGNSTSGYTNTVYVNATTGTTGTWGTPFVLPVTGANPSPDDISSIVAFGGNKVGLLWSNQKDQTVRFAVHADGTANTTWTSGVVLQGSKQADDHLNVKTLQADSAGRVFAVVKTSADEGTSPQPSDPLILLLTYTPSTKTWKTATFGTIADCHTRPQVVLDSQHGVVHVFASAPSRSASGCSAYPGTIYEKTASLDNPSFTSGRGTPVIRDAASLTSSSEYLNNVTTTKQSVTSASGLVVLAGSTFTKRYWHADIPLTTPAADTTAPSAPGNVKATAVSSSRVDLSWSASTDNTGVTGYRVYRNGATTPTATLGGTALAYSDTSVAPSTSYTYRVTAIDAAGNESAGSTATVTTPAAGATTLTFTPSADATVNSSTPTTNYGTNTRLVADGSPTIGALLKFTVTGLSACTSPRAELQLTVGSTTGDSSVYGGDLYPVADTTWSQSTVTWNTRPAAGTTKIGSIPGAVALNSTQTIDVTSVVTADGPVSMMLSSTNADGVQYRSQESSVVDQRPKLVVTCS